MGKPITVAIAEKLVATARAAAAAVAENDKDADEAFSLDAVTATRQRGQKADREVGDTDGKDREQRRKDKKEKKERKRREKDLSAASEKSADEKIKKQKKEKSAVRKSRHGGSDTDVEGHNDIHFINEANKDDEKNNENDVIFMKVDNTFTDSIRNSKLDPQFNPIRACIVPMPLSDNGLAGQPVFVKLAPTGEVEKISKETRYLRRRKLEVEQREKLFNNTDAENRAVAEKRKRRSTAPQMWWNTPIQGLQFVDVGKHLFKEMESVNSTTTPRNSTCAIFKARGPSCPNSQEAISMIAPVENRQVMAIDVGYKFSAY